MQSFTKQAFPVIWGDQPHFFWLSCVYQSNRFADPISVAVVSGINAHRRRL
jgi:hypothetical protein